MNGILASVFTPTQTIICIVAAIVVAALIVTNVVVAYFFNKRGERKLYDKLLQQEREILMQQLRNMNVGASVDKDNVEGVINAVQDSEKYAASEEKTISDLRNIISSAAEKYEVVTKISAPEAIAVAVPPIQAVPVVDSASEPEKPEEAAIETAAEEEEEDDATLADFADEETEEVEVVVTETGRVLRYNRSFTARLIQGGDVLQARYTELKNYLLSYKKVKSRISWKRDSFHWGRQTVATFAIRGKTLCLCLATEPNQYEETKYKVKDLRIRSPKTKTPLLYQIRNERRVGYAKDLIDRMMEELGIERLAEAATEDYRLPYETTEALIERELIKVMGEGGTPFGGIAHAEETLSEPEKPKEPVVEQPVPEDTQEETVTESESQPEEAEPIAEETLFGEPFSQMTIEDEDDTPVLEIFPEEAAEEVVVAEAAPVPEEEEPEEQVEAEEIPLAVLFSENEEENEDAAEIVVTETGNVVRYNVSLTAYVAQGDKGLKERYSALKNCIFSFRGVRNKVYWKRESFRKGKVSLATIVVRGETLCLCLNADPARYANTKYKVEDLSLTSKNTKTPLLYRVQTDRRLDYAKQLIETVFAEHGLVRIEHESVDYAEPYSTTEELIARGLIRVIDDAENAAIKK